MILSIDAPVNTIKKYTVYSIDTGDGKDFPVMSIDKDSYIVGAKIESGINYHWEVGGYSLQIGKYCAMAEDILFMIDVNHNYNALCMGNVPELSGETGKVELRAHGEIIIQNDVWIGHGAVIMDGVTVHNGAVIATNAVVTKDVPPYAIVGGNPAKIIKYRFDEDTIKKLESIAWWDWDSEKLAENKRLMRGNVEEFANHFYKSDERTDVTPIKRITDGRAFVYYIDMEEPYSLWRKVIKQFAENFDETKNELILYLSPEEESYEEKGKKLLEELSKYEEYNIYVNICTEKMEDDADLLRNADFYITNRHAKNIYRMCKAKLYGAKCLTGVDSHIFNGI